MAEAGSVLAFLIEFPGMSVVRHKGEQRSYERPYRLYRKTKGGYYESCQNVRDFVLPAADISGHGVGRQCRKDYADCEQGAHRFEKFGESAET